MKVIAFLLLAGISLGASATPITFTLSGASSGTLDGVAFGVSNFSIYATADTADRSVSGPSAYMLVNATATVTIDNVGTFAILTKTSTIVNHSNQSIVFANWEVNRTLISGSNPAYAAWDLVSNLGPVSQSLTMGNWSNNGLTTSAGFLAFDRGSFDGTFEASVPAPASLAAVGISLLAFRRRR